MMSIVLLGACNSGTENETDSKEVAHELNEEKFDDTKLEDDAAFLVKAADGGMMEVKLGQLAVANAASPAVKQFGQMMVDGHGKANEELKTLAASKNISIPDSLSDKKRDKYNELAEKKGADFDKAYAAYMVEDHKEDIEAYKKAAENAKDAEIKSWAAGKVPVLQQHLQKAEAAKEAVDK